MAFRLTETQEAIRDVARDVARERYGPLAGEWDRQALLLPDEERIRLAELGFLGITLPERYGGVERPLLDALIVLEEIAKENQTAAFPIFEAAVGAARVVELFGTEKQRERWLPRIVKGEATMAVAISEPEAGSAATDISTVATIDGDDVVLNGTKRWCSGAGHAELYLVYCRMSEKSGAGGIGAVVVEKGTPGMTFGPRDIHMGFRGIASADIHLDECRVSRDHVVVPAGGFSQLFQAFSIERLGNATMSLAIATACLERTARYVQERAQFSRPIVEFQSVQTALADMVMKTEASRLLVWHAAESAGSGFPSAFESSVAKCHANEAAKCVADTALQLHGGYGYATEYDIERYLRDSVGWSIAGGTPTMQRIRITSAFLGRRFSQRR